jgi:hypothetical protein
MSAPLSPKANKMTNQYKRNTYDTAMLLAVLFHKTGEVRIRVSEKTVKLFGLRKRLRPAFTVAVMEQLSTEFSLGMIDLDIGGFAIFSIKKLESSKAYTAKRMFEESEMSLIKEMRDFTQTEYDGWFSGMSSSEDPLEDNDASD